MDVIMKKKRLWGLRYSLWYINSYILFYPTGYCGDTNHLLNIAYIISWI